MFLFVLLSRGADTGASPQCTGPELQPSSDAGVGWTSPMLSMLGLPRPMRLWVSTATQRGSDGPSSSPLPVYGTTRALNLLEILPSFPCCGLASSRWLHTARSPSRSPNRRPYSKDTYPRRRSRPVSQPLFARLYRYLCVALAPRRHRCAVAVRYSPLAGRRCLMRRGLGQLCSSSRPNSPPDRSIRIPEAEKTAAHGLLFFGSIG